MRIDLGNGGAVVGTKRVNANGQIAGLKELAGQELLLLVPGDRAEYRLTLGDRLQRTSEKVRERFEEASKELDHLVQAVRINEGPQLARSAREKTEGWVRQQRTKARQALLETRRRGEVINARAQKLRADLEKRFVEQREGVEAQLRRLKARREAPEKPAE